MKEVFVTMNPAKGITSRVYASTWEEADLNNTLDDPVFKLNENDLVFLKKCFEESLKLFVVVSMGGGVLDEVFIRKTESEAEELFKTLTGVTYKEYSERLDKGEDPEEILGEDYDGTQIYEVELKE